MTAGHCFDEIDNRDPTNGLYDAMNALNWIIVAGMYLSQNSITAQLFRVIEFELSMERQYLTVNL